MQISALTRLTAAIMGRMQQMRIMRIIFCQDGDSAENGRRLHRAFRDAESTDIDTIFDWPKQRDGFAIVETSDALPTMLQPYRRSCSVLQNRLCSSGTSRGPWR